MKIVLIILGAVLFLLNTINSATRNDTQNGQYTEEEIHQLLEEYNYPDFRINFRR